jgi:D-xylose transport system permease protein
MSASKPTVENALQAGQTQLSVGDYLSNYFKRVRSGDLGSLPIILGLVIIAVIFQTQNENFLTARNFVNLILQMAGITIIAIGVVYVLLLGEIDLSIGYVSGVAGVLMTWLLKGGLQPLNLLKWVPGLDPEKLTWMQTKLPALPWYVAIPTALVVVALIGLLHGNIITRFQLPAFIVTLAGLLAWNGVVLILVGEGGTIILQDSVALGLANSYIGNSDAKGVYLSSTWAWAVVALLIVAYAAAQFSQIATRRARNLPHTPLILVFLQVVLFAILGSGAAYVCIQDRGLPVIGLIIIVLLALFTYIATSTKFGRYVYAVGGNKEAARRAGIAVERIRVNVFIISSLMAGCGGLVLASRLRSVATDAGGGNLVLNSIAAAVIGGTSLFGGSGRVTSALLGALVVASVENGMGLLGLSSGVKFIITGLVLLVAVLVDSISRRSRTQSGLV